MDVCVHEEGTADNEVIIFIEFNDSFSVVCEVTYSMLSHDFFSVLVVASFHCIKVSKQEQVVVS